MNRLIAGCFMTSVLTLSVASVYAQQPPNPTFSDASHNTAGGTDALLNLILPATYNTAFGDSALSSNTSGEFNAAVGGNALRDTTTGQFNTAVGHAALVFNVTGSLNTAVGGYSQYQNSSADANVSIGAMSLFSGHGADNVAVGVDSLYSGGGAGRNVAIGRRALNSASEGNNIAVGYEAGLNLTTGSYNIHVGNRGLAADTRTIRIGGLPSSRIVQNRAFIAGIYGTTVLGGSAVVIDSNGQLGTIVSSGRFKSDVADMGDASSRLLDLRPVTFHYKTDSTQTRQFGLIAEEVAKVYPDLVVRNDKGEIDSVQYHELAPMLLNELQKQHNTLKAQQEEIDMLRNARARDVAMLNEMAALLKEQGAVLTRLQARPGQSVRVASR